MATNKLFAWSDKASLHSYGIVLADMIGSTQFWSKVLDTNQGTEYSSAWETVCGVQSLLMTVMLSDVEKEQGSFVKGVGDELIFQFPTVSQALAATKRGFSALQEYRLNQPCPPFRFVVHWSDQLIAGWYDLKSFALKAVALTENLELDTYPFGYPQSPDLFGHHMNYAARCMSVVADTGIYITEDAQRRIVEFEDTNIQDNLEFPIVVGGTKGIRDSIVFQQIKDTQDQEAKARAKDATVAAYKTKALINVPCSNKEQAQAIYSAAREVMNSEGKTLSEKRLFPHLFLAFYIGYINERKKTILGCQVGSDSVDHEDCEASKILNDDLTPRVILRLETLDPEHLDFLVLDEAAQSLFTKHWGDLSGHAQNTITRFVRTANLSSPTLSKWIQRGGEHSLFDYLEIHPNDVINIDSYARRITQGKFEANHKPMVYEVARLWGKPSMYALIGFGENSAPETRLLAMGRLLKTPLTDEEDSKACSGATVTMWQGGGCKTLKLK